MFIKTRTEKFLNIISITIIFITIAFCFNSLILNKLKKYITIYYPTNSDKTIILNKGSFIFAGLDKAKKAPYYNYKNLLNLMDEYRKIRKLFYANFELLVQNRDNIKYLRYFLKKLEKEHKSFKHHIKNIKKYHNRSIPNNNRDSLKYYLRVIEDNIVGIRNMLQKCRQYIKLNNHVVDLAINSDF